MDRLLKLVIALALAVSIFNWNQIKLYLAADKQEEVIIDIEETKIESEEVQSKTPSWVDDFHYKWDITINDWTISKPSDNKRDKSADRISASLSTKNVAEPITIDWQLLLDIEYRLKYYPEFDMKIYAPVFPDGLKAIDGKQVIIEGFVIPFDEKGDILALSANPYAACFFCGKASPASVLSLYVKKKKRYKMDDFRKFKGVLHLNADDPEEYYYILRNAVPIK